MYLHNAWAAWIGIASIFYWSHNSYPPQHIRPVLRSGIVFRLVELSGVSLLLSIAFSSLRSSSHRSVLKAFSYEAAIRLHRRYLSRTL